MRIWYFYILLISLTTFADCNAPFLNTPYNRVKFSLEDKLNKLHLNKTLKETTHELKNLRIRYKVVKFEGERVIELLGKDTSQLSKLVRHAQKYETRVFISPSLKEEGTLGFFQTNEDFQRYIFLSPTEVFTKSHEGYATLVHELRHARYDFLRELQVDSFYHTSLISDDKVSGLILKGHTSTSYKNFQSIEELPLFLKDLHSEVLSLRKLQRISNQDLYSLKLMTNQTIELHERVLDKIPKNLDQKKQITAFSDGDEVIITAHYKETKMIYTSFDERLLSMGEVRFEDESLDIVKEIVTYKNFQIEEQSKEIIKNLKVINKKIDDINIRNGKEQVDRGIEEILGLSKKNIQLIRE